MLNAAIINSSDRRLKDNILDLEVTDDDYCRLIKPKRFTRRDLDDEQQIGLIAQECQSIAGGLLTKWVPNETMKKESIDDPDDGNQLSVSYERLSVINAVIIKRLMLK